MHRPAALFCILSAVSALAFAQAPTPSKPSPEEMQRMMDPSMVSMLPMLARIDEAHLEAQLKVAERPDTAEKIASFKKNLFDALRRKGFTAEQSLQLTTATPLPSTAPAGK